MDDDNLPSMTTRIRILCDPPYLTQEAVPLPPSPPLSPLPLPLSYSTSKWTSRQKSAYTICRTYEQSKLPSTSNVTADSRIFTPLVAARLLGWLLVCAPCVEGRNALVEDILECVDEGGVRDCEEKIVEEEEALYALAVKWKRCFLRYFTAVKARTPTPDSPSLDLEKRVSEHSAVKAQALTRDTYHCLLKPSVLHQPAVAHGFLTKAQLKGCRMEYLRCVHIFPLGEGGADEVVRRYAGLIDDDDKDEEKHEHGHHELGNVLTLCSSAQADFCKMDVCLIPTDEESRYNIKVFPPYLTSQYPSSISFPSSPSSPFSTTTTTTLTTTSSLPPIQPSQNLLTLHAALTHALHMSGAAAHLERAMRDLEETRVLRGDGGSVGVLLDALGCLGSLGS